MLVSQFYRECHIPPNLIRHMLEVAAVAQVLCQHWTGEPINVSLVMTVTLIHDLGNLIKFQRPFLGELEQDAQFWSEKQEEMRGKFGDDVHAATMTLARQGGLSDEVIEELDRTGQVGSLRKFGTDEARIIQLADMCVSPAGIVGPKERLADLIRRYGDKVHDLDLQRHKENVEIVTRQLDCPLTTLLESIHKKDIESLRSYRIGSR